MSESKPDKQIIVKSGRNSHFAAVIKGGKTTFCKKCKHQIAFATTASEKLIPVEPVGFCGRQ